MRLVASGESSWEHHHLRVLEQGSEFPGGLHEQFRGLIIEDEFHRFHSRFADLMRGIQF